MALHDLGLEVDFPALIVAAYWVERHCVVPDGFRHGDPFELVPWQAWSLLNFYRVRPTARVGQLAPAFHWRRSQIVGPQKCGKAPYSAAHICVEAVGPALFAGWACGGEQWVCAEHGCPCGWAYEYQPGEAMGMPWPTPLIQVTAFSEDQTDNIYDALRPMIDDGPLGELIRKTGEEFIRVPALPGTSGGRIDTVTSNAKSRLGQRVTFAPQDETGIWLKANDMLRLARVQRRGLAGMGGRAEETTNAWDPSEDSLAQRTAEAKTGDIFRWHPLAPKGLSYRNKRERRKIHEAVYGGCPWVDLDAIEGEAAEVIERDPAEAERFFGNRLVAGAGSVFDPDAWAALAAPREIDPGRLIVIGGDGARFNDALALVATHVTSGYQWPLGIWERPPHATDAYEHPFDEVDGAMSEAFEIWDVWRAYIDPQYIDHLVDMWQGRWGDKRVIPWHTNRPRQIAWAVRNYTAAVGASARALADGREPELTHDGDERMAEHVRNARRQVLNVRDDKGRPMHTLSKDRPDSPRKIDAAMAGVLSWEARGDALAAGVSESMEPLIAWR